MNTFLIECTWEQIHESSEGERTMKYTTSVFKTEEDTYDKAKRAAKQEFDRIKRYGFTFKPKSSVVEFLVTPYSIKSIALIDYDLWLREQEAARRGE